MKLIIFGAPGSGKGTQAQLVAHHFHLKHLSVGELLRHEAEHDKKLSLLLEEGDLVADKMSFQAVKKHLPSDQFLLDGFPRTAEQAELLDSITEIDAVLYLEVRHEEVIKRLLKRGRADDTREVIKHRLQIYHEETEAVLEHYKDKIVRINGNQSVDVVYEEICEKLL